VPETTASLMRVAAWTDDGVCPRSLTISADGDEHTRTTVDGEPHPRQIRHGPPATGAGRWRRARGGLRRGPGGVRLHNVEAGDGPPIVVLHGFPEFWYGWRQITGRPPHPVAEFLHEYRAEFV
jgi:hypothetical protein